MASPSLLQLMRLTLFPVGLTLTHSRLLNKLSFLSLDQVAPWRLYSGVFDFLIDPAELLLSKPF